MEEKARERVNEARGSVSEKRATDARQRPVSPSPAARRPRWPIPLALLGLLALALAVILGVTNRGRSELPDNFSAVRNISGTANSLLNPDALLQGNAGDAVLTNVPVTGQQTIRVLDSSGDNARVLDERTLVSDGTTLGTAANTYAINRRTMEPATDAPAEWDAQPHQGLAVGFPARTEQRDYTAWVSDTQTTTTLRFLREEERGGVNTFVFQADVQPAPIRDQAVLGSLPLSLPRDALQGLLPSLPLSDEQRSLLASALPGLPDEVPMSYTSGGTVTYWVEPTTGQIVDNSRQIIRTGTIGGPGGSSLATVPVYNVDTRFTEESVIAAGREAADRRDSLNAAGRVWPWILGTLGLLALVAGLLGLLLRRRPQPVPRVPEPTARPTGRPVEEAGPRRIREPQPGQPQPPYRGTTQHTGPYREAGQPQAPAREE